MVKSRKMEAFESADKGAEVETLAADGEIFFAYAS